MENQIIEQVRFMSLEEIQQLPDGSKHGIFVGLQTWQDPAKDISTVPLKKEVKPFHPYMLMVSGLDHNITCTTS